jgi:hypothetical protein
MQYQKPSQPLNVYEADYITEPFQQRIFRSIGEDWSNDAISEANAEYISNVRKRCKDDKFTIDLLERLDTGYITNKAFLTENKMYEKKKKYTSIADSPPPREEEPFQQQIFRSFGESHALDEEEDISDADVEYIAIVRESFKDDEYSNKLFARMDNGTLSKSDFILQHERYASSLCEKKMHLLEKMYAISSNIKN